MINVDQSWVNGLYQAIASGLVVGLVVAIFKVKLDQSTKKIDEANDLKISHVVEDLKKLWDAVAVVNMSLDKISDSVSDLRVSTGVIVTEQKNLSQRLTETNQNLRHMSDRVGVNFGKVVRKD